jgi:2-methylcitrate dehydratase
LATGEAVHAGGTKLITAITLAYEMQVLFIEKIPVKGGFDGCALGATFGSAVGAGKILELDKDQFAHTIAMALITNHSLGMRDIGEMSMWKAVYAGMAARQGVFTALMAREGITAPGDTIEGEYGLAKQMIINDDFSLKPLGGETNSYAVERTNLKSYPIRDSLQLIVTTALDLRKKVSASEIESLTIKTYASAYEAARYRQLWQPQTRETADHSMPFCVAVSLIDGDITPETFIRERFRHKDVLDLIRRMQIEIDSEFSGQAPEKRNCYMEAKTFSGDVKKASRVLPAEDLRKGWSDEQVEAKFLRLCSTILTPGQVREILDLLWCLEDLEDAGQILHKLHV